MGYIKSSCPAFLAVLLMIIIPNTQSCWCCLSKYPEKRPTKKYVGLLTWGVLQQKMSWGVLFLLGGGFAIAKAGADSGMNKWLGDALYTMMEPAPPLLASMIFAFTACFFTELTSNVATVSIYIPIILSVTKAQKWSPYVLGLPTAMACSFAFMMPVGTPANSIISGYANISNKTMATAGFFVKLGCLVVVYFSVYVYGNAFFNPNDPYLE